MKKIQKTVFITEDSTSYDTEEEARSHELACRLREWLKDIGLQLNVSNESLLVGSILADREQLLEMFRQSECSE